MAPKKTESKAGSRPGISSQSSGNASQRKDSTSRTASGSTPRTSQRPGTPRTASGGTPRKSQRKSPGDKAGKLKESIKKGLASADEAGGASPEAIFMALDTDCSGTLTVDEIRASMATADEAGAPALSAEEIQGVIDGMDANGDGEISISEFSKMWVGSEKVDTSTSTSASRGGKVVIPKALREQFSFFDSDASGSISVDELQALLRKGRVAGDISDAEIATIVHKFDADGDGEIQLSEFASMIESTVQGITASLPSETSAQMSTRSAEFMARAEAEVERSKSLPTLMSRVGKTIKASGKKVADVVREWDANDDGEVTLQEWRRSLRSSKAGVDATNVAELDELFHLLDSDGGGSLDTNEVKVAMKKCVMEAAKVASQQARADAVVSQLHTRAEEAEAARLVTRRLEELQEKHALVQVTSHGIDADV